MQWRCPICPCYPWRMKCWTMQLWCLLRPCRSSAWERKECAPLVSWSSENRNCSLDAQIGQHLTCSVFRSGASYLSRWVRNHDILSFPRETAISGIDRDKSRFFSNFHDQSKFVCSNIWNLIFLISKIENYWGTTVQRPTWPIVIKIDQT